MKKTPWFDGAVKPVHVGVYERRIPHTSNTAYWRWDGKQWSFGGHDVPSLTFKTHRPAFNQSLPWRGIVKEPT